jgi:serine/threonine-protein kinase RsbW
LSASSPRPPNVRLQLHNQPENISLIRTTLAGVAEAIDLPREALGDLTTAVTEAANNVVLHAYQGDLGSLEVDIHIAPHAVTVTVRDEGIGISGQAPRGRDGGRDGGALEAGGLLTGELDGGSLKLGLPVIAALASRVEFRACDGGGTEVRMEFATPPGSDARAELELATGEQPELLERSVLLVRPEGSALITAATIAVAPAALARSVLPRLLCALAARANFSTDRISDTQLLADAIAAQAFESIIGEHLHVGIAVEPRQVELRVGPLPATPSERASMDGVLGKLAPVIGALADDHSLAPAGPASVLSLALSDRRY